MYNPRLASKIGLVSIEYDCLVTHYESAGENLHDEILGLHKVNRHD